MRFWLSRVAYGCVEGLMEEIGRYMGLGILGYGYDDRRVHGLENE